VIVADPTAVIRRTLDGIPLTRRGLAVAIVGTAGLIAGASFSIAELSYVSGFGLALVVFGALSVSVGRSDLTAERAVIPDVLSVGERGDVRLTVTNSASLSRASAQWRDHLSPGLVGTAGGILPELGSRQSRYRSATVSYSILGLRRGQQLVGPLTLMLADPFGMAQRRIAIDTPTGLIVLPEIVGLPPMTLSAAGTDGATRPTVQRVGLGDDDVIARPYQPGDSMRRLHWRATAHRGELMVRQEEERNKPLVTVILDTAQGHWTLRDGFSPGFEWAVGAAASVTAHFDTLGFRVRLRSSVGDLALDLGPESTDDTVEDALVALAGVALSDDHHDSDTLAARIFTDEPAPTIAILGSLADDGHPWSTALRPGHSGYALVAASNPPSAIEHLGRGGWRTAAFDPDSDMVGLWRALAVGRADYAAR
jgi:uncharacterized protein (DUF58 family)